ncbi:YndJ family transporter [Haladaptatus sp. DFWS20]|uniref:YndJ family transporter n=1 Tax=Haladaptatus sp. DFWS20 TaxID=3403467 RepID=UPI003EB6B30E
MLSRGLTPFPELAIDAALLYVPVGAVALVLSRAGISFHFRPIIVLLTVVHYHYAGFALPLVTGMAGRIVTDDGGRFGSGIVGRAMAATTLVIVVNLALIAVGITFSPLVEVVAVAFFTVAVVVFALSILGAVVPRVDRIRGALLSVAAIAVVWTMALALAYGYSAYPGTPQLVTIDEMILRHGSVNAFGFALPALLAFRLKTPESTAE